MKKGSPGRWKGHPNDGVKRYGHDGFVDRKIAHMKRLGLIVRHSGYGENGGAIPDALYDAQQEAKKEINKRRSRGALTYHPRTQPV